MPQSPATRVAQRQDQPREWLECSQELRALTMHFGPTDVLLTMEIQFRPELSAGSVALAIERLDQAIRARHAEVRLIFLEAQALAASRSSALQ